MIRPDSANHFQPDPKLSKIVSPSATVIEPMLSIDDFAEILNCSRRLVERMKSAGKLPRPDIKVGRMPRWKSTTIQAWINSGGKGVAL